MEFLDTPKNEEWRQLNSVNTLAAHLSGKDTILKSETFYGQVVYIKQVLGNSAAQFQNQGPISTYTKL